MESAAPPKRQLQMQANDNSPTSKKQKVAAENGDDDSKALPRASLDLPVEIETSAAAADASEVDRATVAIQTPSSQDILLGRGKPFQSHLGNLRMLQIVAKHKARYCNSKRENRRAVAEEVLNSVLEPGGRFLRRVDDGEGHWVEVDRETAYDKVSHALRSKKRNRTEESKLDQPVALTSNTGRTLGAGQGVDHSSSLPAILYAPLQLPAAGLSANLPPFLHNVQPMLSQGLLYNNYQFGVANAMFNDPRVDSMSRAQILDSLLRERSSLDGRRVSIEEAIAEQILLSQPPGTRRFF